MTWNADYMDPDVAYLLGLVVGRGTLIENPQVRQLTIEFPHRNLEAEGIKSKFDQETAIRLGLSDIRERLLELLDTDIVIVRKRESVDFVVRFLRHSMIWRNLNLLLDGKTSYPFFRIPPIFFSTELPKEIKREFVRGYADVAGNVRHSNRYVDGRHRVRLDILNFKTNWHLPVELCLLLQEHLDVPVQLITWGHPNLGRDFREHQLNYSFAISPTGFTDAVVSLIKTHSRSDILEYDWETGSHPKTLVLATWNPVAGRIEPSSVLPSRARSLFGSAN